MKLSFNSLTTTLAVFGSRLGYLPANFSPLGSLGFFGNPVLYFASIIIFDQLVGGTYAGAWLTYLGFAAYPLLGWVARQTGRELVLLPIASLCFFFLSNLGSWWYWYPHTLEGLLLCYTLALPFFTRTLLSDLVFGYGYCALRAFQHAPHSVLAVSATRS